MNTTELGFYIIELELKIDKQQGIIADLLEALDEIRERVGSGKFGDDFDRQMYELANNAITKAEENHTMKNQGKESVTVYLPLILGWHIKFKQDLKGCLIQVRKKGTTELLLDVEVDGENTKSGWSSTLYIFK